MDTLAGLGLLFVSSVLVNNFVLARFLGICPFLGVSKKIETAVGMSMAVVFVMTVASVVTWLLQAFVLAPFGLEYLQTIAFILVIAALVQLVEMVVQVTSPALYQALGIFLPLITTNCAVLGVAVLNVQKGYGFLETIVFSVGASLGFGLALVLFSGIRERISLSDVPRPVSGDRHRPGHRGSPVPGLHGLRGAGEVGAAMVEAVLVLGGFGLRGGPRARCREPQVRVHVDPKVAELERSLPGVNCGACGYAGCNALARALAEGKAAGQRVHPGRGGRGRGRGARSSGWTRGSPSSRSPSSTARAPGAWPGTRACTPGSRTAGRPRWWAEGPSFAPTGAWGSGAASGPAPSTRSTSGRTASPTWTGIGAPGAGTAWKRAPSASST